MKLRSHQNGWEFSLPIPKASASSQIKYHIDMKADLAETQH